MQRADHVKLLPRAKRLSRRELQQRLEATDAALQRAIGQMKALEGLAYTDALTGLPNRRSLDERLAQELSRAQRRPDRVFSVLVIDLDGFKQINDTQGHAAGDRVLARFAKLLTAQLRTSDVAARTGGDEFLVLLPDTGAVDCAGAVARLRTSLDGFEVGCSIGSGSWPGDGHTVAALISEGDEAMYAQKRRRQGLDGEQSTEREPAADDEGYQTSHTSAEPRVA